MLCNRAWFWVIEHEEWEKVAGGEAKSRTLETLERKSPPLQKAETQRMGHPQVLSAGAIIRKHSQEWLCFQPNLKIGRCKCRTGRAKARHLHNRRIHEDQVIPDYGYAED